MKKIIIVGGGIAGLSAAHQLVRSIRRSHGLRLEVEVYEAADRIGGKAESQFIPAEGGGVLPGEHGFRLFPQFYRHIVETLKEIPYPDPVAPTETVWDLLIPSQQAGIAIHDSPLALVPRPMAGVSAIVRLAELIGKIDVRLDDVATFQWHLLKYQTSCRARREGEYEDVSWADFLEIGQGLYEPRFERLVMSIPANLSAMRGSEGSARTIGDTTLRMQRDSDPSGEHGWDRVLARPTDQAWLEPWHAFLESAGVHFRLEHRVERFVYEDGRVRSIEVVGPDGQVFEAEADYFICCLPIEHAREVIPQSMREADPALANMAKLKNATADMIGLQYFLNQDVPVCHGHLTYPLTEWALTSVSQAQFWGRDQMESFGARGLKGVISVIISDWEAPSERLGKAAKDCSREEIFEEAWHQMSQALAPDIRLNKDWVIARHLDERVKAAPSYNNPTPLMIHPKGSYFLRPEPQVSITNFFLASDYVRTETDLATMEGADESARTSVRAILYREGVPREDWPKRFTFEEDPKYELAKRLDDTLYKLGLPHIMDSGPSQRLKALRNLFHEAAGLVGKGWESVRAAIDPTESVERAAVYDMLWQAAYQESEADGPSSPQERLELWDGILKSEA